MIRVCVSGRLDAGLTDNARIPWMTYGMMRVMPAATQDAVEQHRQEGEQTGNL
jgi:hypothetical protein